MKMALLGSLRSATTSGLYRGRAIGLEGYDRAGCRAKKALQEIYNAEDRAHAEKAVTAFEKAYGAKWVFEVNLRVSLAPVSGS